MSTPDLVSRIASLAIDAADLRFRDVEELSDYLHSMPRVEVTRIGESRQRQEMFGVRCGNGKRNVSIIAGCHADEPIGPLTAQVLPKILVDSFPELLEEFRFHIVPQMNPDGADRNRAWFRDPFDLQLFLEHVTRELPGDDIEFGFGTGPSARPEALAAQSFLQPHAPYEAHFSLHGMGFAEGAWCLLCKEWSERAEKYMDAFDALCAQADFPLHDIDRGGEKGFFRIREGYTTTPNSVAMKEFFLERNDEAMAAKFLPSSMEWIRSRGGDPLCIVSELPLFLIGKKSPSLEQLVKTDLRASLEKYRAGPPDANKLEEISNEFAISPVSAATQVPLQTGMIVLALTQALSPAD